MGIEEGELVVIEGCEEEGMDTVVCETCDGDTECGVTLEYIVVTTETVVSEAPRGG